MTLKPIETHYNGYRFRSRLEARVAVFLDALGVKYYYEPEGYRLRGGTMYLPDFYLPDQDFFLEVKGIMGEADMNKIAQLHSESGKGVLIVGPDLNIEIMDSKERDWCGGIGRCSIYGCADCGKINFLRDENAYSCPCCGAWEGDHLLVSIDARVAWAMKQARQARFEHGEVPRG